MMSEDMASEATEAGWRGKSKTVVNKPPMIFE
jgi:hypothetical protein